AASAGAGGSRATRHGISLRVPRPTLAEVPHSEAVLERRMVSHDLWPARLIERRQGSQTTLPARVYWPRNREDLQTILVAASEAGIPVVPFGAGSGVCGGVSPRADAWVVDMKRMNRLVEVDFARSTCSVEAGMNGERLERMLNARQRSLGHFPSSIYCSTVGGWLAARSAGQLSSRYGKIEDLVVAVEGVDGQGRPIAASIDDPRTGPAALRALIGSEGALCIFTGCTLRVHRVPSHRWLRGFAFPSLEQGILAMREIMRAGEAPSVLRTYDVLDAALGGSRGRAPGPDRITAGALSVAGQENSGANDEQLRGLRRLGAAVESSTLFNHPRLLRRLTGSLLGHPMVLRALSRSTHGPCRTVVGLEGEESDLQRRVPQLRERFARAGAVDLGDDPGVRWLHHRHRVSYRMSHVFAAGAWVDTMEIATGWAGVLPLYRAMRTALSNVALVTCHFSHAYIDGCSLYFTFVGGGRAGGGATGDRGHYDLTWSRALEVVRRSGATLSHHHGVGRSKLAGLTRDSGTLELLATLKQSLDPAGILNPGVLGLGGRRG
ncbi:MAG: FAD-binding oxidoreductase, partial [Myxococcota bacterium]